MPTHHDETLLQRYQREHLVFEGMNMSEHAETAEELRDVLQRNGFVRCDIAACNCGSWHARYGYRQRLDEVTELVSEAGHPLTNENGHLVRVALAGLIAERDRLSAINAELLEALEGLDEAYCRAGSPLSRDERTEDRKRLVAARAAIAKAQGEQP